MLLFISRSYYVFVPMAHNPNASLFIQISICFKHPRLPHFGAMALVASYLLHIATKCLDGLLHYVLLECSFSFNPIFLGAPHRDNSSGIFAIYFVWFSASPLSPCHLTPLNLVPNFCNWLLSCSAKQLIYVHSLAWCLSCILHK